MLDRYGSKRAIGRQFGLFLLLSGFAAAVNLAVGSALYALLGRRGSATYAFSVSAGYLAGMAISFSLNRTFTFERDGRNCLPQLQSFLLVAWVGLILNTGVALTLRWFATTVLGISQATSIGWIRVDSGAHASAIGLVAVYSFLAHKHLTFGGGVRAGLARLLGMDGARHPIQATAPRPTESQPGQIADPKSK